MEDKKDTLESLNTRSDDDQTEQSPAKEDREKQNYYYSYGPFTPSAVSGGEKDSRYGSSSYTDELGQQTPVEMTKPVPPALGYVYRQDSTDTTTHTALDHDQTESAAYAPRKQERPQEKRKGTFKGMFASFLAGAVVIGGLMFAADYTNLFTSGRETTAVSQGGGGNATATTDASGSESAIRNASIRIVEPETISDVVDASAPAVVKIETYVTGNQNRGGSRFNEDFFREFFGEEYFRTPRSQGNDESSRQVSGVGSGFIFEKSGYILTNEHVVSGADEIYVQLLGHNEPFKAELLGSSYDLDLAVLKITGDDAFPTLPIGDSQQLRVGEWVTAIGNPVGFDHTVSVGVISANEREINISDSQGTRRYKHLLQTDASINPGNSGGPLLNMNGEVVGINTAVSSTAQGIGFAIPTSTILDVLDQLKNNEHIPKPYIGIYMSNIDAGWQQDLGLENTDGVIITQIVRNSPAARAGLTAGDVVLEVEGEKVTNSNEFAVKISERNVGDKVSLLIVRNGQQMETVVVIGDQNENGQ